MTQDSRLRKSFAFLALNNQLKFKILFTSTRGHNRGDSVMVAINFDAIFS